MDSTAQLNERQLNERVLQYIRNGTLDSAKLDECIRAGFDVNAERNLSSTALHIAAFRGKATCIPVLVAAGANVNARSASRGHSPLHSAANNGNVACIVALLEAGADPNLATLRSGRTAFHFVAARGDVRGVAALLAAGANTEAVETPEPGWQYNGGFGTPLATAAMCGNPNAIPTLLRGGAKNCIGQFEEKLDRELGREDPGGEFNDSTVALLRAHRAALFYLHRVAEAGGYRKYERRRRAAVMAMAVRSSKLPAALLIWVEHVADSFPDPLEERGLFGSLRKLGY